LGDFDTAALKDARPRHLIQAVASWVYEMTDFDGVTFASRHGDDLQLWAIFERPGDPAITPNIQEVTDEEPLQHDSPEISGLPPPRAAMGEQLSLPIPGPLTN
jgi:hypothetical protein